MPLGSPYPLGSDERFQASTRNPPLLGLLGATWSRPPELSAKRAKVAQIQGI